ncbi:MAG TPA: TonB family protein [Chthoniobacterales bacterium]|nr:TonB family protein [Chthoniobacterales bacterium]
MTPRDARFWRNVALVAAAHLAVLLALARGSRDTPPANLQSVVWMNSEAAAATEPPPTPPPSPTPLELAKTEVPPPPAASARSEIQMPSPTPTPTPTARPKPTATPTPKDSPKATPKPTPKKTVEPKPSPKPSPKKDEKKSATPAKKESSTSASESSDKPEKSSKGSGSATAQSSELAWYGTMLHDRFHKAWEQPKSIVATGAKMSTIVKIRIEKDGRVSKFTIVKPSGNVVVDESVSAIAQRVTQVDPLPEGLTTKAFYEVKIDFELNAEK